MSGKKIDYLPVIISSACLFRNIETYGIASFARLQREEMSMIKEKTRRSSSISTGICARLACFVEFWSFLLVANAHKIY
jgi:hypothetical protein